MNNKEDIMDNDKTKATESTAEASEPTLVLRPEWEYKPKDLDEPKQSKFVLKIKHTL